MTMQVVLKAGKTFVVASDTKCTDFEKGPDQGAEHKQLFDSYNSSKIKFYKNIAIAESGDGNLSGCISDALRESLDKQPSIPASFHKFLHDTTHSVINAPFRSYTQGAALIVINPEHEKNPIWKIRSDDPPKFRVHEVGSSVIAGHEHNTGIFWREYLLRKFQRPSPSVKKLEMIAATMILACSFINPYGISALEEFGLEMWTWQNGAWGQKREPELGELKNRYENLETDILKHFQM